MHSIARVTPTSIRHLRALACAALLAIPGTLHAAEIYLGWDECRHQGAGLDDIQAVCLSDEGQSELHCSFVLHQSIDDVVGVEVVVDLQHGTEALPAWWQMLGKGMCRDGSLLASGNFLDNEVCTDPWRDLGVAVALFEPGLPRGRPGQARLRGVYAIRSDSARVLVPGVHYYALKLVIRNDRTVFPSSCTGCGDPACLVLNRIDILRGLGSEPAEIGLETSGPNAANRVTWRGGAGASCAAVPARRVTWGSIRALYR
jgi:hypothetical protein